VSEIKLIYSTQKRKRMQQRYFVVNELALARFIACHVGSILLNILHSSSFLTAPKSRPHLFLLTSTKQTKAHKHTLKAAITCTTNWAR